MVGAPLFLISLTPFQPIFELVQPLTPQLAQVSRAAMSMDQVIRRYLESSPEVEALDRQVISERASAKGGAALTNPSFFFVPAVQIGGSDEEFLFAQPLELNGTRRARTRLTSAESARKILEYKFELIEHVRALQGLYLQAVRSQEKLNLHVSLRSTASELKNITRRQVEVGTRPGIDLTLAEVEEIRASQQEALAKAELEQAVLKLSAAIGTASPGDRRPLTELEWRDEDPGMPPEPSLSISLNQAKQHRPEIMLNDLQTARIEAEVEWVRAQGRPDLAPQLRFESVLREPRFGGLGLGISLPIFDHGSRRSKLTELTALLAATKKRREGDLQKIESDVASAIVKVQAIQTVITTYKDQLLGKTQKLLEATTKGFRLGESSLSAVLEARRTFQLVRNDYIGTVLDFRIAQLDFLRAVGAAHPLIEERIAKWFEVKK